MRGAKSKEHFRGPRLRRHAFLRVVLSQALLSFFIPTGFVSAQESQELPYHITGDNLRARTVGGERVWDLTGHVRLEHGTAVATAERGRYWENLGKLVLQDSVVVRDGEMILGAQEASYANDTVEVWGGVRLRENEATLRADWGRYLVEEKRATLIGGVVYEESSWWIGADSLDYRRDEETFRARGEVRLRDRSAKLEATGRVLLFQRETKEGRMTESPVLLIWGEGGEPPTEVRGLRMDFFGEGERADAVGDVVITQKQMTARCDSAVFFNREDRAILLGSPEAEEGRRRITGERMDADFRDGEIRRLVVSGEAVAEWSQWQPPGTEEPRKSELLGDRMKFFFEEELLTRIVVIGHARSIYYPEESKRIDERNSVEGERITLTVENDEADRILVENDASGSYTYATEVSEDSLVYETVDYAANEIEYFVPENLIRMDGEADVEYGTTRLKAGRIEYDSEEEWMLATQKPILWERQDRIDGTRMTYNLGAQHGTIFGGRTKYDKGYYTGRRIRKVGERELNADWGVYTSCDKEEPHYSFRARRMKLYLKDKVVARPLVLYVRDVPLLALPYYVFPIKPGRHSGLLIPNLEPGISKDKGRFIKNVGYYWALNEYSDLALWGDFYEDTKWVGHFRGRYSVRYLLSGSAEGSYTSLPSTGVTKRRRWDLRAHHNQNLTDQLKLTARADFVSDETYRIDTNDIDQSFLDRINRELKSSLSLNQRWSDRSLALTLDRRQYLNINELDTLDDTRVVQTLPSLSFKVFRKRLSTPPPGREEEARWYQTIYYDVSSQMSRRETLKEYGESTIQTLDGSLSLSSQKIFGSPSVSLGSKLVDTRDLAFSLDRSLDSTSGDWRIDAEKTKDEERWASRSSVGLRASPKLWQWLDFRPAFNYEFTLFDRDRAGTRRATLHTWSSSLGLGTTLYGTFLPGWGKLEGVRHVVKPSASLTYRPEFDRYDSGDYDTVGGIRVPALRGQNTLNLSLSNMFHLKIRDGEDVRKIDNVVQLTSSTSYDFRYKENNRDHPFSDLRSSLLIQPSRAFDFRVQTTHDLHEKRVKSRSFTSSLKLTGRGLRIGAGSGRIESVMERSEEEETERHLERRTGRGAEGVSRAPLEPWTLSLSHRYTKSSPTAEPTQWLNADLTCDITHNWKLTYGNRYDINEKEIAYQRFTLYRDLHCWEARISGEYSNEQWTYYFKINIKAHPELYIERGQRRLGGGGLTVGGY